MESRLLSNYVITLEFTHRIQVQRNNQLKTIIFVRENLNTGITVTQHMIQSLPLARLITDVVYKLLNVMKCYVVCTLLNYMI